MLAGVQLSESLKLEAIADGGFSYAEIPYEIIEKDALPTYRKSEGESRILKVSGFSYPLAKLTPDKLYELLESCRKYQANYIVLDTMNCEAGILENVVEECSMMITDYRIPVFIENGCNGSDETGYLNGAYSDISSLKSIAEYCNKMCDTAIVGICINVGYSNLLAKNVRSQIDQCSEYLCMVHVNDNGGVYNEKQMPFTFTRGRGNLITDWYHIIGALIKMEFSGWLIFDNNGTYKRVPEMLQTQYVRMLHAIADEWQEQFTFIDRVLNKPDKKLILFGAGQMLSDYMDVLGDKYPPYFAVDNGQNRWKTKICGVDVKEPLAILDVPEEERNVVICCMYYDSISAQLKSMGVEHSEFQDRYYV